MVPIYFQQLADMVEIQFFSHSLRESCHFNPWFLIEQVAPHKFDPCSKYNMHQKHMLIIFLGCRKNIKFVQIMYFRTGYYESSNSIHINFGELFDENDYKIYREGIKIIGNYANIQFAKNASFHIEWTASDKQIDLFYWEISGLFIKGWTESELVQIGHPNPNKMAWNSCKFEMNVNNGYVVEEEKKMNDETFVSPAIGIKMIRVLQSKVNIVATCKQGTAAWLQNIEFCSEIAGSFSNGQIGESQKRIYKNGRGLFLKDCVSNSF